MTQMISTADAAYSPNHKALTLRGAVTIGARVPMLDWPRDLFSDDVTDEMDDAFSLSGEMLSAMAEAARSATSH